MDPVTLISLGVGIVGLGTSIFGGAEQVGIAKQKAGVSADIAGLEGQENDVRRQAMEMSARRAQIQTVRTAQRARAMAVQAGATQTGSLTGSGVKGGVGETESEGLFGLQGINNNLSFGRNLFGIDSKISADKIQLAQLGGSEATAQGITSLGGAMLKAAPMMGNIFGGFGFGSNSGSTNNPYSGSVGNPMNLNSLY